MERYKNLNGNSGVLAFEIGTDSIAVEFSNGAVYLYTYASASSYHIEQMKRLAKEGAGLCAYIGKHVRKRYAQRLR